MVNNAAKGLQKQERIQNADDFNKREEARLAAIKAKREAAKAANPKPDAPKVAKKNKDGKFICANKGCTVKYFTDEENVEEDCCNYHPGEAVFHDLKKYWNCCNPDGTGKCAWDWDEFLLLPTCSKGKHVKKY